jgi:hypothetical protein
MKIFLILLAFAFSFSTVNAQFYYKEYLENAKTNVQLGVIIANKIGKITISKDTDEGVDKIKTTQSYSNNYQQSTTKYFVNDDIKKTVETLFANKKIASTLLVNKSITNTISYTYNDNNLLVKTDNQSNDSINKFSFGEQLIWQYNSSNKLASVIKIKNKTDTVKTIFSLDNAGNIIEENSYNKNRLVETFYYYYSKNNQLTDVVKYFTKVDKLLPIFTLEYNNNNELSVVNEYNFSLKTFVIHNFFYNTMGLLSQENIVYKNSNQKETISYEYQPK